MDFEDELDLCTQDSGSKAESAVASSQDSFVRASRKSGSNKPRRMKKRTTMDNGNDDDEFSGTSSTSSLVVRGAGASSWAVQDAGTLQMLSDECSYLCSALMSARTVTQALENALELAQLLSSKKSRGVLWQSCASSHIDSIVPSPLASKGIGSQNPLSPEHETSKEKTILDAVLDVIACVSTVSATPNNLKSEIQSSNSSISSGAVSGSPARRARTKSARRKLKQQEQNFSTVYENQLATCGWWNQNVAKHLPELSQALALIVYFISLDCTLSKDHSVAAAGAAPKPVTARAVRSIVMKHQKALQGIIKLCLKEKEDLKKGDCHRIPKSVASDKLTAVGDVFEPEDEVSSSSISFRLSVHGGKSAEMSKASSPAESSISSLSFGGENLATAATPKASGDPTKTGRLKRQRRRQLQNSDPLQESKLPAVPECSNLERFDYPQDKIVPPPSKRRRKKNIISSGLSFTSSDADSEGAKDAFAFTEPLSPTRTNGVEVAPRSPGDQSVASSVVSADSALLLIPPRLSLKLSSLRAKAHFSSFQDKTSPFSSNDDCPTAPSIDPWTSLLCLESLARIISGKEGEGVSCLNQDQNDDDSAVDEESNPLVQTNLLLGKSGLVPLLSKCMIQELIDSKKIYDSDCQLCLDSWHAKLGALATLIDNACLFNISNRRSFAEHHDPFSFEQDPIHNDKGKGMIYHILQFLHDSIFAGESPVVGETRLIALRTLTSLTHDNELAAEQMVASHIFAEDAFSVNCRDDSHVTGISHASGVHVLANLVYNFEATSLPSHGSSLARGSRSKEEEVHQYDSTIFCFNTLSNIIEAPGVRRLLTEITIPNDGKLWIKWLCQWLVAKTKGFRDAILSIGYEERSVEEEERTLQKHDDDKLVAAGNACVLLACLLREPEEIPEDPERTKTIRNVVLSEMPPDRNGKSTGIVMIINTLKAFCNFYHFSIGELSLAIIGPVKQLIDELQGTC